MIEAKSMVRKRNLNETAVEEESIIMGAEITPEIITSDSEDQEYEVLLETVQKLRSNKDIIGYLLKGEMKATVDLNDSTKIIEYAMFTSQAFESAETLSSSLNIGNIETILIEGEIFKTLCINRGPNKLGIFMKKDTDDADILETFLP
jgi:predicted regulator of Ras-like GTPase activity (Roadblock/LC7/MglB family)